MSPRIIFGIVLARCSPHASAGHICATMSWAVAFRELGWEVWLTEHLSEDQLTFSETQPKISDQQIFWDQVINDFGFQDTACLLIDGKADNLAALQDAARSAEFFLNYSGQFKRFDFFDFPLRKAYLDVDPAFTQLWVEACHCDMNFDAHDSFLTIGLNINGNNALLPSAGRQWCPVTPPLPEALWNKWPLPAKEDATRESERFPNANNAWTTIGHWYGYSDLPWNGRIYAGKRASFLAMQDLPHSVKVPCAIATDLQREWGDYDEFEAAGWTFYPTTTVCRDVSSYLHFINTSRGEIGIAKGGYIESRCGWISDRSLVYLSLGKPVLLQDTGWTEFIDTDAGLLAFRTKEDCAAHIREIEKDWNHHSKATQAVISKFFAPKITIPPLLNAVV